MSRSLNIVWLMTDWLIGWLIDSDRSSIKERHKIFQASLPDSLLCQCMCVKSVLLCYSRFIGPCLCYSTYFSLLFFYVQYKKNQSLKRNKDKLQARACLHMCSKKTVSVSVRGQGYLSRWRKHCKQWNKTEASKLVASEMLASFFRFNPKQVNPNIFLWMWASLLLKRPLKCFIRVLTAIVFLDENAIFKWWFTLGADTWNSNIVKGALVLRDIFIALKQVGRTNLKSVFVSLYHMFCSIAFSATWTNKFWLWFYTTQCKFVNNREKLLRSVCWNVLWPTVRTAAYFYLIWRKILRCV